MPAPVLRTDDTSTQKPLLQNFYTEDELITGLYNKDKEIFSYLYDHYAPSLFTLINSFIKINTICEDVLQEAFLKIWNNFHHYDKTKGRLFTWMISLTRNIAIDTNRNRNFREESNTVLFAADNLTAGTCEFKKFDSLFISKYLEVLSDEQVNIIKLAYFWGLTQPEIAYTLNMPPGTVKTNLRNGLVKLRMLMNEKKG